MNLAKSLAKDAVTTTQYNDILAKLRMMCTSRGFFLPHMNIVESGQSSMQAQQWHRKMLLLLDAVYKDISKQMHMEAMHKVAERQEVVDTGKCLNLLDLQLYAQNEQEQQSPILTRNLEQGNQWLEDSTLENVEVDKDDNFYTPKTASHKSVEYDDEIDPKETGLKRTSPTSLTTPCAKKQKSTTTSCNIPNESASVMSNVKGRG